MQHQCEYCSHTFTIQRTLNQHYERCKQKPLIDQKKYYETQLEIQKSFYEAELEIYRKQLETLQAQYVTDTQKLQVQLNDQKELTKIYHDQIFEIAKQPKTVNNQSTQTHNNRNTNIINQLAIYDLTKEQITQLAYQHFNLVTFHGGPEEIAKLAAQFLLTDPETQKPKVTCTDISRKNFKYVDEGQEVQVDPGFQKTHDLIKGPLSQANVRVYVDKLDKNDQYRDQWKKNDEFISDRVGFSDKIIKFMT